MTEARGWSQVNGNKDKWACRKTHDKNLNFGRFEIYTNRINITFMRNKARKTLLYVLR